jgi:acetolactate synthase I/III small subunit
VLNRVASLFRRRNYNIESLTVGHTERPGISRMTIVVLTDEAGAGRIEANLYKLVNVISGRTSRTCPAVYRDLAIIKVAAPPSAGPEIVHLVDVFRARIVDLAPDSLTIEITGGEREDRRAARRAAAVRRARDGAHGPARDGAGRGPPPRSP